MQYEKMVRLAQSGNVAAKEVISNFWIWFYAADRGQPLDPSKKTISDAFRCYCKHSGVVSSYATAA